VGVPLQYSAEFCSVKVLPSASASLVEGLLRTVINGRGKGLLADNDHSGYNHNGDYAGAVFPLRAFRVNTEETK